MKALPLVLAAAAFVTVAFGQQQLQQGLFADDPFFGQRGDGAAEFRRFDADFPDGAPRIGGTHLARPPAKGNCSVCGGRDGCVGCLCVKKCATPQANESLPFLSRTLGSHMVLQRAPASAMVFGHAKQGASVTTTFGGKDYTTTVDSVNVGVPGIGTWRQKLPPTPASREPHTLTFASSAGDHGVLEDVLFGEVYLCSGPPHLPPPFLPFPSFVLLRLRLRPGSGLPSCPSQ